MRYLYILGFLIWLAALISVSGKFSSLADKENSLEAYKVVPQFSITTFSKRPQFIWIVETGEAVIEQVSVKLDNNAIPAQFDRKNKKLTCIPGEDLGIGPHVVECEVTVEGYKTINAKSSVCVLDKKECDINPSILNKLENMALSRLNNLRKNLNLPLFSPSAILTMSAQSHSNFLKRNNTTGHNEIVSLPGFIGIRPWERAKYFGFNGIVAECIDYGEPDYLGGIEAIIDAPYHRLILLNPNFNEIGLGFNTKGNRNTVINCGTSLQVQDNSLVVYPYIGQQDAKIGWIANENPNPLAQYGLNKQFVGYPITVSAYDNDIRELKTISAVLTDAAGKNIAFYQIDSTKENDPTKKQHLFIIPKEPLRPGMTYQVTVQAERILQSGDAQPVRLSWSFSTLGSLTVRSAVIHRTPAGADQVDIKLENGTIDDLEYVLKSNNKTVRQYNAKTATYFYSEQSKKISDGIYDLELKSSYFSNGRLVKLKISSSNLGRQVEIFD